MSLSTALSVSGLLLAFGLPVVGVYRRAASDALDWARIRRVLGRNWVVLGVLAVVAVVSDSAGLGFRVPNVGALVDGLLYGFVAFGATMILVGLLSRFAGGVVADEFAVVLPERFERVEQDGDAGRRGAVENLGVQDEDGRTRSASAADGSAADAPPAPPAAASASARLPATRRSLQCQ